jgi:hypothetical protein
MFLLRCTTPPPQFALLLFRTNQSIGNWSRMNEYLQAYIHLMGIIEIENTFIHNNHYALREGYTEDII